MAHEIGHVLGFGHPNEYSSANLAAKSNCSINNATCRDPFSCGEISAYPSSGVYSIMHSITRVAPESCLFQQDLDGLHMLYPVCDDAMPSAPLCDKTMRLAGWLRLAIVTGFPLLLSVLLILLPITCCYNRDRHLIRRLADEVEDLHEQPQKAATSRPAACPLPLPMARASPAHNGAVNRSLSQLPLRTEEEGRREKHGSSLTSPVQVMPSASADQFLDDDDGHAAFKSFARRENCEDYLLFWEEVHAFHGRWEGYGSGERADALRENDAEEVIAEYLNEGSSHQVFAGDARVDKIVKSSSTTRNMFDELQRVAYHKLQVEVLPKFIASPEGLQLLAKPKPHSTGS
ncbi:MAG: hypothetical protein SGPRY_010571 [Prymnesium sp.]